MITRTLALVAAGAVLPATLAVTAAPAHADIDRGGSCGTGRYELSVDREGRGYEVSVDLDALAPGSRWRVVLRQDGTKVANVVRRAERDGDLDIERYLRDTAGSDTFAFTATRVGGGTRCGASVKVA